MLGCSTAHVCIPELARACNKCKVCDGDRFAGVFFMRTYFLVIKNVPSLHSFFALVVFVVCGRSALSKFIFFPFNAGKWRLQGDKCLN